VAYILSQVIQMRIYRSVLIPVVLIVLGSTALAQKTDSNDPIAALADYYNAINARDYKRAFGYWESPPSSFDKFARGFADTGRVTLLVDPSIRIEGAAGSAFADISTVVIADTRGGNERVFAGCYVMRRSNVSDTGWHIYRANISPVQSSARISRMLTHRCD
jgi:hypothetical protein